MDDMSGIMKSIIKSAEAANKPEEGDYYDEDGFLVCGNCHTRRQVEIDMPDLERVPFDPDAKVRKKVPVSCRCRAEKQRRLDLREQQEKELQAIEALKKQSLMDERLRSATFDQFKKTEHNAWNLKLCLRFAEHFDEMLEKNQGLLFYGGVGTGKTFAAACIANYLLDHRVPVVMTSFVKLLDTMKGFQSDDQAMIAKLNKAKLRAFASKSGKGIALLVVAAVFALYLLGWVFHTIEVALELVVPAWAASLIVVGILLLIVLILALVGARSLKSAQAHRPDPAASVAATKEAIEKGLGK